MLQVQPEEKNSNLIEHHHHIRVESLGTHRKNDCVTLTFCFGLFLYETEEKEMLNLYKCVISNIPE